MKEAVSEQGVYRRILLIRGERVMIDADLAELYGVSTMALNQAVKRNINRFPPDFMFTLTSEEKLEVITNCDNLRKLKYYRGLPHAFTEHGALMLASVLNSERAVEMSLTVIRVFVKLREMLLSHKELAAKFAELERRIEKHDEDICAIFEAIRQLMAPPSEPPPKPKLKIGFDVRV
jgi:hypothetical protein